MDIIVTTPKSRMADAAREAAECIANEGGEYFRRFSRFQVPKIDIGERVYYVEDGYIRGFAVVSRTADIPRRMQCDTTGRWYDPGFYVFMPAESWYNVAWAAADCGPTIDHRPAGPWARVPAAPLRTTHERTGHV